MRLKLLTASVDEDGTERCRGTTFNNDNYSVAHPALSLDGKNYFLPQMSANRESDLWYVDIYKDGSYGDQQLGSKGKH